MSTRVGRLPVLTAAAVVATVIASGCSPGEDPSPASMDIQWAEQSIPDHPGRPGRTVLRDAARCGESWWLVGAVFLDEPTETQDTRPAAWSSADGVDWTPVPVRTQTYWGRRAVLSSVACSRGRVAIVGARSGGAHGNPRVTTFRTGGDGLVDVPALFTQYGGATATGVGPIVGGPQGWLITGSRLSGPGVWVSDDPRGFTKVEGEPGLVGDGSVEAVAQSGVWDGEGWTLVGGAAEDGSMSDRDPIVWTSPDGLTWEPQSAPSTTATEDMHRAVSLDDGRLLALGLSAGGFAAWTRSGSTWTAGSRFGEVAEEWSGTPYVASIATASSGVLATLSDAQDYQLWGSSDATRWTPVDIPRQASTASDHALVVAADSDAVLLVVDDGEGGQVFTAESD